MFDNDYFFCIYMFVLQTLMKFYKKCFENIDIDNDLFIDQKIFFHILII